MFNFKLSMHYCNTLHIPCLQNSTDSGKMTICHKRGNSVSIVLLYVYIYMCASVMKGNFCKDFH